MQANDLSTKVVYLAQVTPENMNSEHLIALKQMLTNVLSTTKTTHLIVEVYINKDAFNSAEHFNFLMKMVVNAYNLFEPEQSTDFPTVKIEYIFPEIFGCKSILLRDPAISHIYYRKSSA